MKKLTIHVKGKFHVSNSNEFQCGVEGQSVFDYEVSITGYSCDVESQTGFLFDNAIILDFFRTYHKYHLVSSCELIAQQACDELVDYLRAEEKYVSKVVVTIRPNDFARLECEWTPRTGIMNKINNQKKLKFGKYRGYTLAQIYNMGDTGYLTWLANNQEELGFVGIEVPKEILV